MQCSLLHQLAGDEFMTKLLHCVLTDDFDSSSHVQVLVFQVSFNIIYARLILSFSVSGSFDVTIECSL